MSIFVHDEILPAEKERLRRKMVKYLLRCLRAKKIPVDIFLEDIVQESWLWVLSGWTDPKEFKREFFKKYILCSSLGFEEWKERDINLSFFFPPKRRDRYFHATTVASLTLSLPPAIVEVINKVGGNDFVEGLLSIWNNIGSPAPDFSGYRGQKKTQKVVKVSLPVYWEVKALAKEYEVSPSKLVWGILRVTGLAG